MRRRARVSVTVSVALLAAACGGEQAALVTTPITAEPDPGDDPAAPDPDPDPNPDPDPDPTSDPEPVVEPLDLAAYTDWSTPTFTSIDDRQLVSDSFDRSGGGGVTTTSCTPNSMPTLSKSFDDFPAFGMSGDPVPGTVVEARGLLDGDLRVLPLERSPVTLVSSLASANPVVEVERPTTSALAGAVAELKRDADARLTGIDVVPSDVVYTKQETHSFEQTSLELGVSLRYDSALRQGGLDSSYEQERGVERHTISVRFLQPMYDVTVERDGYVSPRDVFARTVGDADLDPLLSDGRVAADNPPALVDQVTYGRVMYFTMSSTQVESASELQVAVDAAQGAFSGEGELTQEERSTLSTSEISMLSYGGDQGLALAAIRSGDLSQFFGPANTTTAAPLAFTARTLDGQLISTADTADLQQVLCQDAFREYSYSAALSAVNGRARLYVNGSVRLDVRNTEENIFRPGTQFRLGSGSTSLNDFLNDGLNQLEVRLDGSCTNEQYDFRVFRDGEQIYVDSLDKCVFSTTREYDFDTDTDSVVRTDG